MANNHDSSPELEEAKRIHGDTIKQMHEMGYGLMKDGDTFYKLGYELNPRLVETFTMREAYAICYGAKQLVTARVKTIKQKWDALKIRAGASAGSAQGIMTENGFGEKFDMQVDRDAYRDFIYAIYEV